MVYITNNISEPKKPPCPNEKIRSRAKMRCRIFEGMTQLWLKKWKICIIALWLILAITALVNIGTFTEHIRELPSTALLGNIISSLLGVHFLHGIIVSVAILLSLLILAGVLYLLGVPPRSNEIERDMGVALVKSYRDNYKRPFLISARPLGNTDLTDYHFYARWLTIDEFQKAESSILTALKCQRAEQYRYGGRNGDNRRIIVVLAGIGAKPTDKGELYDDEL